jgi:two-component system, chemotaxis family, chemotaxis protein CheY
MATTKSLDELIHSMRVLIVDDEHYMRKVVRSLLLTIGVKNIHEANDGPQGLAAIKSLTPDLVLVDYNMPGMTGADFVRTIRSPDTFPYPHVPIIMLTGNSDRSLVVEAVRLGVNEYLLKPVSSQALRARVLSIITNPRKMIRKGDYYGPEPRRMSSYKPENDPGFGDVVMVN